MHLAKNTFFWKKVLEIFLYVCASEIGKLVKMSQNVLKNSDFTKIFQLKGLNSEAQTQRSHKLLWMLWYDKKSISNVHSYSCQQSNWCAVLKKWYWYDHPEKLQW